LKKIAKIFTLVIFLSLTAAGVRQAHAIPALQLSDTFGSLETIFDGGLLDSNPLDGVISYSDLTGTFDNFSVVISVGITKPVLGSASRPHLDLNSVNVTNVMGSAADTLTIKFTDTDFTTLDPSISSITTRIGGTSGGAVTFDSYFDNGNAAFATTTQLASLGSFSGAFSQSVHTSLASLSPAPTNPYSMTLVTTVTNPATSMGGARVSSYDAEVTVPEPGTLLLLGSGLLGLGLFGRKRING
jgi:hypothetical protein